MNHEILEKLKLKRKEIAEREGKKLFGGIVANTDRDYRGRWIYFDKSSKELRNDFSNWKDLIL
jgi:hypothetical protein